jgi:transposase
MFIKRNTKTVKGKKYVNHLLVESVNTPKGPRHKVVCYLGNLDPGPPEKWARLAQNIEKGLAGQLPLEADALAHTIVDKVRDSGKKAGAPKQLEPDSKWVTVDTEEFSLRDAREAGSVHVGHQMWEKLQVGSTLRESGLSDRACLLTEMMTINRLVEPASELATVEWVRRTALPDILGDDVGSPSVQALYRNMDRLHEHRATIETALAANARTLFNLQDTVLLYDLTSTYFEGQCGKNEKAKHGYSRDGRPDCKQVVIGLVVDEEGFPKAHEIFDGNRTDGTTVGDMLTTLDKRLGRSEATARKPPEPWPTVVMDRGMSSADNLQLVRQRHYHYVVAAKQGERDSYLADFDDVEGWESVIRMAAPTNPYQVKSRVLVKPRRSGDETHIMCVSAERSEKDRAIRQKHEQRLLSDLSKLQKRVSAGRIKQSDKIHQAIGRLMERYPRVARYYEMTHDEESRSLHWHENAERKERASQLDGAYLLKTDRDDLTADEIWRLYSLLTRIESAFRDLKSPLGERPLFHQTGNRVETHIFICVLAYHLLVAIEKLLRNAGIHCSWETIRKELRTHQIITTTLPSKSGRVLRIRKGTKPEPIHKAIYNALRVPEEIMRPRRSWHETDDDTAQEQLSAALQRLKQTVLEPPIPGTEGGIPLVSHPTDCQ